MTSSGPWPCVRVETRGGKQPRHRVVLDLSVAPNAKRTEITGWHDGALRVRLAAPPVDGAANEALHKWLAAQLGLSQSQVELLRGASGRRKQWAVDAPVDTVQRWLSAQPALQK